MRREIGVCVLLVGAALAVYAPALGFDFVRYDDARAYQHNELLVGGLTSEGLRAVWTREVAGNWMPVALVSHMLDFELYGARAAGHHATNVALHALAAVALFAFLRRSTGALWPSAAVAGLFAVHPLNVEVVAWIAQRRTLLTTLFGWMALDAYVGWTRRPGPGRYAWTTLLFALGLGAKATLVTLPAAMLLLDAWPLGRLAGRGDLWPRVREKLPWFALALSVGVVAVFAQREAGAVVSSGLADSLARGLPNALHAYTWYLVALVWPAQLAVHYAHPYIASVGGVAPSLLATAGALALLLALSVFALRAPAPVGVGWLWFLGSLLPMIGLLQVGSQGMADRYAYFGAVGVFVAVAFGTRALLARAGDRRAALRAVALLTVVALLSLGIAARGQVWHWRSSEALYTRALEVDARNVVMLFNLGNLLYERGEPERAEPLLRRALAIDPRLPRANFTLGFLLAARGERAEAISHLEVVVAERPKNRAARRRLAELRAGPQP